MGSRKNDMEENLDVMDGDFGSFENGAFDAHLQIFHNDQAHFTSGKT